MQAIGNDVSGGTATRLSRHEHRQTRVLLWAVAMLLIPTALMAFKTSGLPGAAAAERVVSLSGVPGDLLDRLRYILFVPLGAVVIVLFRVTLGLRVLGPFRSILLAVAFQITGIPLGLLFLALVVGAVVALRPVLRDLRVPYFGRMSITVSVVATLIVLFVMLSKTFDYAPLYRVAYFPIVVLCLAADGFARAVRREGLPSALWRGAMTALAAVLITWITALPEVLPLLLRFPELLLLNVGVILILSEYFAFRLLRRLGPAPAGGGRLEGSLALIPAPARALRQ